jgi:hypothetical protein
MIMTRFSLVGLAAGLAAAVASWPGAARANIPLTGCGLDTTIVQPSELVFIYWATDTNSDPLQELTFGEQFMSTLNGSRFNGDITQYYQFTGFNGTPANACNGSVQRFNVNATQQLVGQQFFVNSPAPPTSTPDCDLEQSVIDSIAPILPGDAAIFLQLGPGVVMSCNSACAYHNVTANGNPYAVIPYVTGPDSCGPSIYDTLGADLNHEYAEMLTDPRFTGWTDGGLGEIGDPCADWHAFPLQQLQILPTGSPGPAAHAGFQPLWSDAANSGTGGCVYSYVANSANFFTKSDGQMWRQVNNNTFASVFGTPGASFTSAPSVVTSGPPTYDVFAFDSAGHLGHMFQNPFSQEGADNWGGPPTGTTFLFRPEVASMQINRLDVFISAKVNGVNRNRVYRRTRNNSADSGWVSLGAPTTTVRSGPAAVSWGFGELDVFVVGSDGNLYRSSSTNGTNFSAWSSVGRPSGVTLTGTPDVASWGQGRLDVFMVNSAGTLSHYFFDQGGGFSGWDTWPAPSGVRLTGSPTATGMGDQRLRVSAVTTTGQFVQYMWDFGNFTFGTNGTTFSPSFNASSMTYTQ